MIKRVISILGGILLLGSLILSVGYTQEVKKIGLMREKKVDIYEVRWREIVSELALLYTIKDESSYSKAKNNSRCSEELKSKVYGKEYSGLNYIYGASYSVLEVQHSIEGEESYYILGEIKKGGKSYILRSIVYVSGNQIYDLITI